MTVMNHPRDPRPDILRPLLRSPLLKDILRMGLKASDPKSGARTADTLLGEDPEVLFALASSIPAMVNTLAATLARLAFRLRNSYGPDILRSMFSAIARDIDTKALRECAAAWKDLAVSFIASSPSAGVPLARELLAAAARTKAFALDTLSMIVTEVHRTDPKAWSRFVSEVLASIDRKRAGEAAFILAEAVLDQRWGLASWCAGLLGSRIRKKIGRIVERGRRSAA